MTIDKSANFEMPRPRLTSRQFNERFTAAAESDGKLNADQIFCEIMTDDDAIQIARAMLLGFVVNASNILDELQTESGKRQLDATADQFLTKGVFKVLFFTESDDGDTAYGASGGTFRGDTGKGYQDSWNTFVDVLAKELYQMRVPVSISIWTRLETTLSGQVFKIDCATIDGRRIEGSIKADFDDSELIGGNSEFKLTCDERIDTLVDRFWVQSRKCARRERATAASEFN